MMPKLYLIVRAGPVCFAPGAKGARPPTLDISSKVGGTLCRISEGWQVDIELCTHCSVEGGVQTCAGPLAQDFNLAGGRFGHKVGFVQFGPFLGRRTIAKARIDAIGLHAT